MWVLRTNSSVTTAEPAAWQACRGNTECIQSAVAAELQSSGAVATLAAALAVFETNPTTPPGCHGVAHYIGRAIAASGERTPALGDKWLACGGGVLHGVFETLSLPGDPFAAGREAYGKCRENEEISSDRGLLSRCVHALGHSIYTALHADIAKSVQACQVEKSTELTDQCLAGVYMMDRNERWPPGVGPRDADAWKNALPHCADPAIAAVCVLSYGEVPTFISESSTLGWLDLCFAAKTGAGADAHREQCLFFVGQGAAINHVKKGSGPGIDICLGYADQHVPQLADACLKGLENGIGATGTPVEQRQALSCEILAESRRRCT